MKIKIPYLSQITYKPLRKNTKFSHYNLNLCNYGDFEIKNINDKADDVDDIEWIKLCSIDNLNKILNLFVEKSTNISINKENGKLMDSEKIPQEIKASFYSTNNQIKQELGMPGNNHLFVSKIISNICGFEHTGFITEDVFSKLRIEILEDKEIHKINHINKTIDIFRTDNKNIYIPYVNSLVRHKIDLYSIANYVPFVSEIDDKININDFMEKNNQKNIMVNLSVLSYFSEIANKSMLHNFESTKKFVQFFDGLDERYKKLFLDIDKNSKSHFDTVRFLRNFMTLSKRNEYLENIFTDLSSKNYDFIFAEHIKKYENQSTNKM